MSGGLATYRGKRRAAAFASVAVATTALLASGGTVTAAADATTSSPARAACSTAPAAAGADARVMAGYAGVDPNSMSLAQSKTWDAALQQRVQQRGLATRAATAKFKTITIDVRVHVITRNNGTGGATPKMVLDQIKVLNRAYAGKTASGSAFTPFRFVLKSYDVTPNTNWYNWSDSDDRPAKKALHQGGYDDLNMYVTGLSDGLLGYAYYPQDQVGFRDGVVLLNESLPGGTAAPYNEGDTATHEIGHWLGLAHTFENGCSKPGDFVADTPYQADGDNIFYCDESLNTCPQPGKDPVHNFMSYGDDPCLDQFTEGQSLRMLLSWLAYRDPAV